MARDTLLGFPAHTHASLPSRKIYHFIEGASAPTAKAVGAHTLFIYPIRRVDRTSASK